VPQAGRPSICYVSPGRDLRAGSSACRQVLTLARALAPDAEVTVVFRRVLEERSAEPFAALALEPAGAAENAAPSRRALGRFVEQRAECFGVVLEGSWPMSGKLTAWCEQRGVPAIPVLDRLPSTSWLAPLHPAAAWFESSGRYLRRAPVIVAGSRELRDNIAERWRVPSERIAVIAPAVDRPLFAPRDQGAARRLLGVPLEDRVLVVAGGLDRGPQLGPLMEAVARTGDPGLRLHVLGHGERRQALERRTTRGGAITFHGPVFDELLAAWIGAADLCVSVGEEGDPAYSVQECLSAGRPVVLAGVADARRLPVVSQVSGFVIEHDLLAWIRFLQRDCPSRNTLRMMGMAAAVTPIPPVEDLAAAYLEAIHRATVRRRPSMAAG
jgi:glycosyltransferase involved in cell wall biosynthesis